MYLPAGLPGALPRGRRRASSWCSTIGRDDGTRDFLAGQPDVTLIGSGRRYGDLVVPSAGPLAGSEDADGDRLEVSLASRFAPEAWSVLADADEFVVLPPAVQLADVARLADGLGTRCVTGVMLDVYPARLEDFEREGVRSTRTPSGSSTGNGTSGSRKDRDPRVLYPGARARLMAELRDRSPEAEGHRLIGWSASADTRGTTCCRSRSCGSGAPEDSLLGAHRSDDRADHAAAPAAPPLQVQRQLLPAHRRRACRRAVCGGLEQVARCSTGCLRR